MGRAELRRAKRKGERARTATYNVTKAQLDAMVQEGIGNELERLKQEAVDESVNDAMLLLLVLPMKVLMDHYWTKTCGRRIPEFIGYVLEYYRKWQDGELDMDELREELWEYGGVRLEKD